MNLIDLSNCLRAWTRSLAGLDPRSLACFRVGIGVVLLYDIIGLAWPVVDWWPGMQGYYDGLSLPEGVPNGVATLKLLLGVYALLALGVLLGYRTRSCTLAAWLALALHRYVSQTIDYHDDALFHALFWAQFLDWGQRFSLDARWGRATGYADGVRRLACCGLVMNLTFIYVSTALEKSDPAWWIDGTAVYFALGDVALSGPLGRWIVQHAPLAAFPGLSYSVLAVELVGGLLIITPWARVRLVGLLGLTLLQGSLWACMRLESFPATMLSLHAALLPSAFWTRWGFGAEQSTAARPCWQRRALLALLAGVVAVNAEGLRLNRLDERPYPGAEILDEVRDFIDLQGVWQMYAPSPPAYTFWWVCVGRTRSGAEIDPITGRPPTFAQPDNKGQPFGGLGSVYWFYSPDEQGEVQRDYARFLLWRNRRRASEEEWLTHFSLFCVYRPFLPLADAPHDPMPILVLRWPEEEEGVARPLLQEDSALHGVELYELDYERWGEVGEAPKQVGWAETY